VSDIRAQLVIRAKADQARAEIAQTNATLASLGARARTVAGQLAGSSAGLGALGSASSAAGVAATALNGDVQGLIATLRQAEGLTEDQAVALAALAGSWAGLEASVDPVVVAYARFAEAEEVASRAVAAGIVTTERAGEVLDSFAIKLGLAENLTERQAAEAARLTQSMAALRASLDPTVAAEQRLAEAQEMVSRATAAGVVSAAEGKAALDGLAIKLGLVEGAAESAAAAQMRLRASSGAATTQLGILTAQWNDVIMMTLAGQNPMQMAIQQGTSITQVFGNAGAAGALRMMASSALAMLNPFNLATIAAIAIGAALVQWGMSAWGAGEKAKTLSERVDDLTAAQRDYETAAKAADVPMTELIDRYGNLADEVKRALEAKRELAAFDAKEVARAVASKASTMPDMAPADVLSAADARVTWAPYFAEIAKMRDAALAEGYSTVEAASVARAKFADNHPDLNIDGAVAGLDDFDLRLAEIQRTLGVSREDAEKLAVATARWMQAANADDQKGMVETGDALTKTMAQVFGSISAADKATGGLASAISNAVPAVAALATGGKDVEGSFGRAAGKASELGDALERVASLKRSSLDDLAMSTLERQFNGDAIALAGARAGQEFDAARKGGEGADPIVLRAIEQERQAYVARAVEIERNRQAVEALNDATKAGAAAGEMLASLRQEAELRSLVLKYGEDALVVTLARVAAEREVFEEQQRAAGQSGVMLDKLMAAWDAANGLASVDIAGRIAAAVGPASQLAEYMRQAAGYWGAAQGFLQRASESGGWIGGLVSRLGWGGTGEAPLISPLPQTRPADKGVDMDGDGIPDASQTGGAAGGGGSRGGGAAGDTVASLQKEAAEALKALDLAVATIQEKVRAGVMTSAEAGDAVVSAKDRAMDALAELVAKLEALGPAGAAAAAKLREALGNLGKDLKGGGLADGLKDLKETFVALPGEMATGIRSTEDALEALRGVIQRLIADLVKTRLVEPLLTPLLDGVIGLIASAKGNVISGGKLSAFELGGLAGATAVPSLKGLRDQIVDRPILFPMAGGVGLAGEADPEAIMPLIRGGIRALGPDGEGVLPLARSASGHLAVRMPALRPFAFGGVPAWARVPDSGGAARSGQSEAAAGAARGLRVDIHNNAHGRGEAVQAEMSADGDGDVLRIFIDQVAGALSDDIDRNRGKLPASIARSFGLRRPGR
jgi:hypothetical protein